MTGSCSHELAKKTGMQKHTRLYSLSFRLEVKPNRKILVVIEHFGLIPGIPDF